MEEILERFEKAMESRSGGIGFPGALALVFIVLKLVGVISWSWWWVLAPIWGLVALGLAVGIVAIAIALLVDLFRKE